MISFCVAPSFAWLVELSLNLHFFTGGYRPFPLRDYSGSRRFLVAGYCPRWYPHGRHSVQLRLNLFAGAIVATGAAVTLPVFISPTLYCSI